MSGKQATLWISESGRMVRGDYELHCGDGFDLFREGVWNCVRIEHTNSTGRSGADCWYLIFAGTYDGNGKFTRSDRSDRRTGWAVDFVGCMVRREDEA